MAFLSWIIGLITGSVLFLLVRGLFGIIKRHLFYDFSELKRDLGDLAFAAAITFAFACALQFGFQGFRTLDLTLMFGAFSVFILIVSPMYFVRVARAKQKPDALKSCAFGFIFLLMILEVFSFNSRALGAKPQTTGLAPATSARLTLGSSVTSNEDGSVAVADESSFVLSGVESGETNVEFVFLNPPSSRLTVKMSILDEKGSYYDIAFFDTNPTVTDFNVFWLPESPRDGKVKFSFYIDDSRAETPKTLTIARIDLQAPIIFDYSAVRHLTLSVLILVAAALPGYLKNYKTTKVDRKPYLVLGGIALIGLVAVLAIAFADKERFFTTYPLTTDQLQSSHTDIYTVLFDAIRKGQFKLDIVPDPRLVALEDPYLADKGGASYLWDHAFYKGSYYCYYGIFPVLFVMFPLYLLTGMTMVPLPFLSSLIGFVLLCPAFLALILEINRLVTKRVNWPLVIGLGIAALFVSLSFCVITFKDGEFRESIYHLPIVFGLLNFDLFFFFFIRAYRRRRQRKLNLALSGLFLVFLMMSRPNMAIGVIAAVPLAIGILRDRRTGKEGVEASLAQRLLYFVPMAAVVVAGAVFVSYYNYARFDSIFEFGASYQLENRDLRTLKLSFNGIIPTIRHYYLQGFGITGHFPYIYNSMQVFDNEPALYVVGSTGILLVPLLWAQFGSYYAFGRKDKAPVRALFYLFPIIIFALAFTTYCKAGVCPRYMLEIFHLSALAGVGVIFRLTELGKNERNVVVPVVFVASLASVFVTFNLVFDGFSGLNSQDLGGLLQKIRAAFVEYNV